MPRVHVESGQADVDLDVDRDALDAEQGAAADAREGHRTTGASRRRVQAIMLVPPDSSGRV